MAEEKSKQIPIEDGDAGKDNQASAAEPAEADEAAREAAAEQETDRSDAETSGQAEGNPEETAAESGSEEGQSDDEAAKAAEEAKVAEEQESERYMRLMAEFQNFKRRAAREKSDIHAYANEKIIGELLPVLDNFERALETKSDDVEGYAKGMELIFTQLKTALEHAGLSEIQAAGEDFDPNIHNAVMTEQSDEHEDGKVSKVLQKGYKLNDKVIRPSMVAVVRN